MFGRLGKARWALGVAWLLVGLLLAILWLDDEPSIEIAWQTETEFESAGFNVLRSQMESGPYVKANEQLIPASNDALAGADYSFVDTDIAAGQFYYYQLEDIDFSGNATRHAPIAFQAPGKAFWLLPLSAVSLLVGLFLIISGRALVRQG